MADQTLHESMWDEWDDLPPEDGDTPEIETFRTEFANSAYTLLEPLDSTVNYSFEVASSDPWTLELTADKWWIDDGGRIGHEGQTLKTYSLETMDWEQDWIRQGSDNDRENLLLTYQGEGLEAAMRQAEGIAVANGGLNPNRADGRLFTGGPPDRFLTLREAELLGQEAQPIAFETRDISKDETQELPAIHVYEPGSWEELVAEFTEDAPEAENHYWQMHTRPVETPEGERLGTALFVTEYPQLSPDFTGEIPDDAQARMLEMAHFTNEDDARKFETEFRSYLVLGLLDGPELAPEVAKLEGLSGEWEEMDYRGFVDYMSGSRTIVRKTDDWQLHNPNAEREKGEHSWDVIL